MRPGTRVNGERFGVGWTRPWCLVTSPCSPYLRYGTTGSPREKTSADGTSTRDGTHGATSPTVRDGHRTVTVATSRGGTNRAGGTLARHIPPPEMLLLHHHLAGLRFATRVRVGLQKGFDALVPQIRGHGGGSQIRRCDERFGCIWLEFHPKW